MEEEEKEEEGEEEEEAEGKEKEEEEMEEEGEDLDGPAREGQLAKNISDMDRRQEDVHMIFKFW